MLSILLFFILTAFTAIGFTINYYTGITEIFVFSIIFLCCDVLCVFFLFFTHANAWNNEVSYLNAIQKYKKLLILKKQEFENSKVEWIKYLTIEYPNIEKDIFDKMSPDEKNQLTSYYVKYPELSSGKMFTTLIGNISKMYNDIYELEKKITENEEDLKNSFYDKWTIFHSLLIKNYIETNMS